MQQKTSFEILDFFWGWKDPASSWDFNTYHIDIHKGLIWACTSTLYTGSPEYLLHPHLKFCTEDDNSAKYMDFLPHWLSGRIGFNPYPANIFVQNVLSSYYVCCIIYSNALQINFIKAANTMNPDQTTVWSGSIVFAITATKVHKQKREQTTIDKISLQRR